ncbi:MAG: type II toxin-antitoxin system prevent-host-death family antitoxin [Pseudomonadota bacterium]|nr:type II toxin-antitoxin system prevent-host-death family antitoxin [Pseudomonadota bacterium]
MSTISYSALRANLSKSMQRVCDDHRSLIITREKAKSVVMISLEDYEAMQETCYLLRSPVNAARLAASIDEIEAKIAKKQKK